MQVIEHISLSERLEFSRAFLRAMREMILRQLLADWHGG